ncbi:MAG TPA: hypothetical protein RMH85_14565 [Polyangiaceae bacterium LLY-WYZ-15_(1-7)]|nr:hypothetical protein [Myxococcales bacterium]MBJ69948.1 hypothetical protein [Sandaracinus sp.]HJK91728.1 hypothetical protein [Polyangiaceae bacterium LLY-WYZ-15_(1-7)]HJL04712.1 hypothetical protein [Polyangiaceae bacterium LLY-WYZ-15_(1-7)]HJL09723.1 hypothetical protein [Polyangiaceae bacterium LLY-WYZ-15_(1-7)]
MADEEEDTRSPAEIAIDALLEEARELDYGPERIAKAEEAVRQADQQKLEVKAYDARLALIEATVFGGYPEKGFVAFGWCAAKSDEDPERFQESRALLGMFLTGIDLLWSYKWMTLQVPWYPQLSRAQIDETLDDMEARYRKHGLSLRPVYMQRTRAALEMGDDLETAHQWYRKWQWAPRDLYADCEACEVSFQAQFHAARDEHERALQLAAPLFDGTLGCAEVPHMTYGRLLGSALALGQAERAAEMHAKGYGLVRDNRDFVVPVAEHVHYLVRAGELEEAKALVERHLPWAVGNRLPYRTMRFFAAARDVFGALDGQVEARLPEALGGAGAHDAAALAERFDAEAKAIAARFDARNGNDVVGQRIAARVTPA